MQLANTLSFAFALALTVASFLVPLMVERRAASTLDLHQISSPEKSGGTSCAVDVVAVPTTSDDGVLFAVAPSAMAQVARRFEALHGWKQRGNLPRLLQQLLAREPVPIPLVIAEVATRRGPSSSYPPGLLLAIARRMSVHAVDLALLLLAGNLSSCGRAAWQTTSERNRWGRMEPTTFTAGYVGREGDQEAVNAIALREGLSTAMGSPRPYRVHLLLSDFDELDTNRWLAVEVLLRDLLQDTTSFQHALVLLPWPTFPDDAGPMKRAIELLRAATRRKNVALFGGRYSTKVVVVDGLVPLTAAGTDAFSSWLVSTATRSDNYTTKPRTEIPSAIYVAASEIIPRTSSVPAADGDDGAAPQVLSDVLTAIAFSVAAMTAVALVYGVLKNCRRKTRSRRPAAAL